MGAAERVGEVWMDGIGRLERMVACWRAGFRMFSLEFRGAWDDVPELGYIYIFISSPGMGMMLIICLPKQPNPS